MIDYKKMDNKKLYKAIMEDVAKIVKRHINENYQSWMEENDDMYHQAVDILAEKAIEELIGDLEQEQFLANATDLHNCEYYEIELLFSILNDVYEESENKYFKLMDILEKPFSIKDTLKRFEGKTYGSVDLFQNWVNENKYDVLDEEMIESLEDRYGVASIVNKKQLGGGGFEMERHLEIDCSKKIAEIIKNMF